ncbi:odorant receptor 2a [Drosophila sechellia]|uniref:Odorant receptor n=1 Tax=Drosophila sechellia TaxID=7238 RepID=B4I9S9_DROSE|nr:odorant receptor 2a [Drosophila sechellia]EDW43960.1 GM19218 [Drosophila sechellia]
MANQEDSKLDTHSAVYYHWRVWELTGLMRPPGVSSLRYVVYSITVNLVVTVLFPLSLLARLLFTTNMAGLCENLTITITDIVANLKFANVYMVRKQLHEIRSLLRLMDARARMVGDPGEISALRKEVNIAQGNFRTFASIFVFGTIMSCVRVVVRPDRELLYPAWFGVDWMHSTRNYVLINIYQLFGLIVQAIQNCASDSYPPAFLCLLTGHMRALELRVRRIGCRTEKSYKGQSYEAWREEVYQELIECIRDLARVHRLREIIQRVLSVACMAQFVCSAAVQCTVAMHFLYMADDHDHTAMIISIVFFSAVTLEVFVICYFGDRMRTQSEALCDAFYDCNWVEQLPKFKRELLFTLARTQRPSLIYAGNYIALSLETFEQVMRFTYSVFTLLLRAK